VASLGDVGDALRRVLVMIGQSIAAHHRASELAEQARNLLQTAGSGSSHADVEQACAWFTRVIEEITEPEGQLSTLATIADEIRSYLHRNGLTQNATPQQPARSIAEQVEVLRRELPPPVQPGTGQRKHGRWRDARSVAVLEVWYDQTPDNDFGPGDPAIVVRDQEELTVLVDRVSAASARQLCPSIITVYVADDPYRFPSVRAGIGAEVGYVQIDSRAGRRATLGNQNATEERVYDFQGHGEDIPVRHEVPLDTVRRVLAAYLDHGGLVPADFPHLHEVAVVR
jgi:hypothetical protein